jgi:methionyl-tRNA formyltransferase
MSISSKLISNGKVALFVMTEKGYEFLRQTYDQFHQIFEVVVVGADENLDNDYKNEILDFCRERSLPCIERVELSAIRSEYVLAISWRWMIDHPEEKLIVFHDSILPKYRGFAPLVNSLINGETEIGVSALFGAKEFDAGDVICQCSSTISYPIKIADAIKTNNMNYLRCAKIVLNTIINRESFRAEKQKECLASYSVWRDECDYYIDWKKSSLEISRFIDAVGPPYQGARTLLNEKLIVVTDVEVYNDVQIENRDPGKVLFFRDQMPIIICGEGLLLIKKAYYLGDDKRSIIPLSRYRARFGATI